MIERTTEDNLGAFDVHPAPMWEAMCRVHPGKIINHTLPHYGPLLYSLGRIQGGQNFLEIGNAQGYSSGFLAHAVKDNNARYGMTGKFYGLDIADKSELQTAFEADGLPVQFIKHEAGSVDYLEKQTAWGLNFFDLIFIDGFHNNDYVQKEVSLLYPLLKGKGEGYLVLHDTAAYVELACREIRKNPYYQWEFIRFVPNYGLTILRKMDGLDREKIFWPEGDQKGGFVT